LTAPPDDGTVRAARELKARYVQLMDARRWDEWMALFVDDALLDASEDMTVHGFAPEYGVVRGRERILRGSRAALDGTVSLHQVSAPTIEAIAADVVRATWAMTDRIVYPDGRVLAGSGTYDDVYAHTEDGWRIRSVRLTRTALEWEAPPD
jgi:hypothetical protein